MANRHYHLGKQKQMTMLEMISAVERLQVVYTELREEQTEAKQKIKWAINHLSDKIWTESL
jgi:allophanate hydrolase subunit 1